MSVRLTDLCVNGGCGCKIDLGTLRTILSNVRKDNDLKHELIVGATHSDDAAVVKLDDERGLISTTDFFTPIVDDPYTFGQISACNAISDVYAMGGKPVLAIGILGWPPASQLSPELAARVLDGALAVCHQADIPLGGGHSIVASEPFFGLAVNGIVPLHLVKRNGRDAVPGSRLFLTKPLGVGVKALAYKRGIINEVEFKDALESMTTLNKAGQELASDCRVLGLTDVTGFGIAGHLGEVCDASGLVAEIHFRHLPLLEGLKDLITVEKVRTGAARRNWENVKGSVMANMPLGDLEIGVLCDPQTSGPLLIISGPEGMDGDSEFNLYEIGRLRERDENESIETKIVLTW